MDSSSPTEPGPEPELLEAISRATRYVGEGEARDSRVPVRFDAARQGRGRVLALMATLAVVAGAAAYLSLHTPGEPPLLQQEEDLRWAVEQVVRRVESLRARTGELPTADALHGLLSDLITYQHTDGVYVVVGERGEAHVEYDGSIPLEEWLGQSRDAGRPPP